MPAQLVIRRCTVADAPALAALARRTFYDTFTGTCSETDMQDFLNSFYNEPRIAQELSNPEDYTFFALQQEVPVGYLRFLESPVTFPHNADKRALELNRLYVDKPHKGRGVAQALMDFYLNYAKDNAYAFLWLGVWEYNYRAQAFYRKYGFAPTGYTHPFPVGNTPQTDEWWARGT
jgi:ribosomal protein S18 acetylase RimI-like enzyme